MLTTLIAFIVTLGILIVVHEWGHYRMARACGVKVLRFSVGFGRPIWRRQGRDGTEYVVSALPLGGYVKMLDEREGPVDAEELDQAFNRKSLGQRAAIVVAGPAANLILAVALYAVIGWVGVDEPKAVIGAPAQGTLANEAGLQAGDWIQALRPEGGSTMEIRSFNDLTWQLTRSALNGDAVTLDVSDRSGQGLRQERLALDRLDTREIDAGFMRRVGLGAPFSEPVLSGLLPDGAAAAAGLREGDRVLAVGDVALEDAATLRELIRGYPDSATRVADEPQTWLIERDGARMMLPVRPATVQDGDRSVGRVGAFVGQPIEMARVTRGPVEGVTHAVGRVWEVSALSLQMLGKMLIGDASLRNLSGPLTIADYAGQTAKLGWMQYLAFLALISVSLGVLNLLPLPVLDGGHLMYYLFEAVTGRPVSEVWLDRLQRGGVAILLMLMSLAVFNDVSRLIGL